jgi:hypothetical protein
MLKITLIVIIIINYRTKYIKVILIKYISDYNIYKIQYIIKILIGLIYLKKKKKKDIKIKCKKRVEKKIRKDVGTSTLLDLI